jgi:hypothetical protein
VKIYVASSWRNPHQPTVRDGEEPELMALLASEIAISMDEVVTMLASDDP